ncbi:MAG: glycoside hydrolase family 15 protein [Acidimicrobiales bacterium]
MRNGERLGFALRVVDPGQTAPAPWSTDQVRAWLYGTIRGWQSWSALHQGYQGPYADLVHHSGRVLKALTYAPTGAIVAAPTTSLPEELGGERNWDYRYTWVRDASFTLSALWIAACPDEVADFFEFFAHAAGGTAEGGEPIQILYGVRGERRVEEQELDHLPGYRDSRPVRIGNAAWRQSQLDVYGELLDAAGLYADRVGSLDDITVSFLADMADRAANRWEEPDHGIWEMRGERRHFLYSKLMCWVALDRACALTGMLRAGNRSSRWSRERARIREAILEQGWSDSANAFTQSFGHDDLDASALMIPIVGFLPGGTTGPPPAGWWS